MVSNTLTNSVYGYARVSTTLTKNKQHFALQTKALKEAGCEIIYSDRLSGTRNDRPERKALFSILKEGDTVIVWKLDRWGRSMSDLTASLELLEQRGVKFVSVTEAIDTRTIQGRLLAGILSSIAVFEREIVIERIKAGLAASKRKNGRPKALTGHNVNLIKRLRSENVGVPEIAKQFSVSRQTVYSALQDDYRAA
jgi:DNA invertase Pin-like site-specific DNA recombinase